MGAVRVASTFPTAHSRQYSFARLRAHGWHASGSWPTFKGISESWLALAIGIAITAYAGFVRLWRLGALKKIAFDETYYVKDAYAIYAHGYEAEWIDSKKVDIDFAHGIFTGLTKDPSYVVHPPFGKWLMTSGMHLFGPQSAFGWRFAVAIAGTLTVALVMRLAWQLFDSALLMAAAGMFVATDPLHLSMSRIGLLDGFVSLFVVAGFVAFVADQKKTRSRQAVRLSFISARRDGEVRWEEILAPDSSSPSTDKAGSDCGKGERVPESIDEGEGGSGRPRKRIYRLLALPSAIGQTLRLERFFVRPWLLGAGILLGMASAVKWSGLYVLAVVGLFAVVRELTVRHQAGFSWGKNVVNSFVFGAIPAFIQLVGTAFVTYAACWTTWFVHRQAWGHGWAASHGLAGKGTLKALFFDWAHYHVQVLKFHVGVTSKHPYQSTPVQWLFDLRPTSMVFERSGKGDKTVEAMVALGNPIMFWLGVAALVITVFCALRYRDWRAGVIVAAYLGVWAPWLYYSYVDNRTIFMFYMTALSPFVALANVYVLGILSGHVHPGPLPLGAAAARWEPARVSVPREAAIAAAVIAAAIIVVGIFFMPVATAAPIPYSHWRWRMWLASWI